MAKRICMVEVNEHGQVIGFVGAEGGVPSSPVSGGEATEPGATRPLRPKSQRRRTTGDAKALVLDAMFGLARGTTSPRQLDSMSRGGMALSFLLYAERAHGAIDNPDGLEVNGPDEIMAPVKRAKDNAA